MSEDAVTTNTDTVPLKPCPFCAVSGIAGDCGTDGRIIEVPCGHCSETGKNVNAAASSAEDQEVEY